MIFLDLGRDFLYTIIDVLYFIIEKSGFTDSPFYLVSGLST